MIPWIAEYSFAGDFFAIIICLCCVSVLRSSYTIKQANLNLYYIALFIISCSSIQSIIFHAMLTKPLATPGQQFTFFSCQNSVLIGLQVLLLVMLEYLMNLFFFDKSKKWKSSRLWTWPAVLLYAGYKFYSPLRGMDIHLNPDTLMVENYGLQDNIYIYLYVYLFAFCAGTIIRNRHLLIEHVYRCLTINAFLPFVIIVGSYILNVTTFICISFTLPVLAVLFLFHYNAYDVKMGTLDLKAFRGYMEDMGSKAQFVVVSLYLKKNPIDKNEQLSQNFLQYVQSMFVNRYEYNMFRVSGDHFLLVYEMPRGADLNGLMALLQLRIEYGLKYLYRQYGVPHQLVYIHSAKGMTPEDYIGLSGFITNRMTMNEIKICTSKDVEEYRRFKEIDEVFQNIQRTNNFNDERVIVHYQPILDSDKKCYKAEALMRLKVGDTLLYPGDFLPIVESENYSQLITKIMLNKVCLHIKELEAEGYNVGKISINLSTSDLLVNDGYRDLIDIVEVRHGLSFDKIAFEILEYTDDADYTPLVKTMTAFSAVSNVEFYLDDFGSGYSNLLRLLSLPVKIIKFDRSILKKMRSAPSTKAIIQNNIQIFVESGYQILFEGVESEEDLALCEELGAHYYQGYHFAKPADLNVLKTFLVKAQ
jgi:EAL domain-containing protein (putative c-di-GMP-specific phosphodiesterase class I)